MDQTLLGYYKTIGEVQSCISSAETLDEALQNSLHIIVDKLGADLGLFGMQIKTMAMPCAPTIGLVR